jgi:hypothetical protein
MCCYMVILVVIWLYMWLYAAPATRDPGGGGVGGGGGGEGGLRGLHVFSTWMSRGLHVFSTWMSRGYHVDEHVVVGITRGRITLL